MIVMSMGHVRTQKARSTVPVTLVSQKMALSVQTSMNVTTTMEAVPQTLTVSTSLDLLNVNVKEAMK